MELKPAQAEKKPDLTSPELAARAAALNLITGAMEKGEMLEERALQHLKGADRARAMTLAKQVMRWIGSADQMIDASPTSRRAKTCA